MSLLHSNYTNIYFANLEWGEWIQTNETEERYRHCMRKTLRQRNETLDGKFFSYQNGLAFLRGWGRDDHKTE